MSKRPHGQENPTSFTDPDSRRRTGHRAIAFPMAGGGGNTESTFSKFSAPTFGLTLGEAQSSEPPPTSAEPAPSINQESTAAEHAAETPSTPPAPPTRIHEPAPRLEDPDQAREIQHLRHRIAMTGEGGRALEAYQAEKMPDPSTLPPPPLKAKEFSIEPKQLEQRARAELKRQRARITKKEKLRTQLGVLDEGSQDPKDEKKGIAEDNVAKGYKYRIAILRQKISDHFEAAMHHQPSDDELDRLLHPVPGVRTPLSPLASLLHRTTNFLSRNLPVSWFDGHSIFELVDKYQKLSNQRAELRAKINEIEREEKEERIERARLERFTRTPSPADQAEIELVRRLREEEAPSKREFARAVKTAGREEQRGKAIAKKRTTAEELKERRADLEHLIHTPQSTSGLEAERGRDLAAQYRGEGINQRLKLKEQELSRHGVTDDEIEKMRPELLQRLNNEMRTELTEDSDDFEESFFGEPKALEKAVVALQKEQARRNQEKILESTSAEMVEPYTLEATQPLSEIADDKTFTLMPEETYRFRKLFLNVVDKIANSASKNKKMSEAEIALRSLEGINELGIAWDPSLSKPLKELTASLQLSSHRPKLMLRARTAEVLAHLLPLSSKERKTYVIDQIENLLQHKIGSEARDLREQLATLKTGIAASELAADAPEISLDDSDDDTPEAENVGDMAAE